jgi:hypothetical protein
MNPANLDLAQAVADAADPHVDHDPLANDPDPLSPHLNHPNLQTHLTVNPLYLLKLPQSRENQEVLLNQQVDPLTPLTTELKIETVIMTKIKKETVKEKEIVKERVDVIETEIVKEKEMMIEIEIEMTIEGEIVIVQKVQLPLKNNKDLIVLQEVRAIRKN